MKNRSTQSDTNMNFDGMESMAPSRSTKFAHNMWSGHSNDGRLVQKTQAPNRTGNNGMCDTPKNLAASVTKDTDRRPMTSATPKLPAQGSVRDSINRGSQVRNPGGTVMPKRPSNPDKIRMGQSGGPGYGQTTKGSRPTTSASQSDFNYGPKSQY
jgi:hypothetical protein